MGRFQKSGAWMAFFADAAIPAGTELTVSYVDVLPPVGVRASMLEKYGCSCKCPRCERESNAEVTTRFRKVCEAIIGAARSRLSCSEEERGPWEDLIKDHLVGVACDRDCASYAFALCLGEHKHWRGWRKLYGFLTDAVILQTWQTMDWRALCLG